MLGVVTVNLVDASSLPSSSNDFVFLLELFDILLFSNYRIVLTKWCPLFGAFDFSRPAIETGCSLPAVWHVRSEIS